MNVIQFALTTLAAVALLMANLLIGSQDMLDIAIKGASMISMYALGLYAKSLEK